MTISSGRSSQLRGSERIITGNEGLLGRRHFLIGITRLRNEELILRDTLDYVGKHVDAIIAYDDASTDSTLEILRNHEKVALIVSNGSWEEDIEARLIAEGRHRGLMLQLARAQLPFEWMFCFDADERVTGDMRSFLEGPDLGDCEGIRVPLFDAYMTPNDSPPYQSDRALLNFRGFRPGTKGHPDALAQSRGGVLPGAKSAGAWRNKASADSVSIASIMASHCRLLIGKRLAITTFDIFRVETYGRKWRDRKGRAIHTQSISCGLYEWGDTLFAAAVKI